MNLDKWYNTEDMCLTLLGNIPSKSNMTLNYYKSWNKEYFFKKEEITAIKKRVREMRSGGQNYAIVLNARILSEVIPFKESKKESRPKRLGSVKFIMDEI